MPIPSVLCKNELDPKSGIVIIEVGCKFVFDDQYNDNQTKRTNIQPGGSDTLWGVHDDCCRGYFGLMRVQYPNGETETLIGQKTVEQGYCGGQLTWHLINGAAIAMSWSPQFPGHVPLEIVVD